MIVLLLKLLLVAQAGWVEGHTIGVRNDSAAGPFPAIFVNSYENIGMEADKWHLVDLSAFELPAGTKSVFLTGLLIITHGLTPETCNLTVSFRAPGDLKPATAYVGQTIEASVFNGQRSTMSTFVPVKNGKFEFYWHRATDGQWPLKCAYAINLKLQAYVR